MIPLPARIRRLATSLALLALLTGAAAAIAHADGDPASDELVAQNVFIPYSSPVPQAAENRLNAAVARLHRRGIALKVALIARRSDLGSVTALYGAPQRYARFLDTELSYGRRVPLLVVMRAGFGMAGLPGRARRTLLAARPPTAGDGTALAAAATAAITRLTTLRGLGHAAVGRTRRPSPGARTILLLALILAALLVGGLLVIAQVFFAPATVSRGTQADRPPAPPDRSSRRQ